jgi:hypothetical protein
MDADKIGVYKKITGSICHYCPICKYGREKPRSFVGKILHHPMHADNCAMWKAEKILYSESSPDENKPEGP